LLDEFLHYSEPLIIGDWFHSSDIFKVLQDLIDLGQLLGLFELWLYIDFVLDPDRIGVGVGSVSVSVSVGCEMVILSGVSYFFSEFVLLLDILQVFIFLGYYCT